LIAVPSLAALFDEKDDDRQGRDAINPPPARHEKLSDQPEDDRAGEVAADDRLDRIGAERRAADPIHRSCHGIWCDSRRDLYVVQPGEWGRIRRIVKYTRQ
jgi:hypothetical protein